MEPETILIKKYENRRLYDSTNSRYVNLDDIAQIVKNGHEVKVVDAATGEDLTRVVLTQIIVETVKAPGSGFPLDMLRQMVVASGRASQDGFLRYMKAMFDLYQNTYRAFNPGLTPFDLMQSVMGTAVPPSTPPEVEPTETVADLRKRLEELERIVKEQPSATPARKRGPRGK
jgi:polyhydroxyalkanoate synthesis repressor PhaR